MLETVTKGFRAAKNRLAGKSELTQDLVDESLRDKVRGRVPKAIKVTKFARDQRDRRIAHAVLAAVEGYSARGYWALAKRP